MSAAAAATTESAAPARRSRRKLVVFTSAGVVLLLAVAAVAAVVLARQRAAAMSIDAEGDADAAGAAHAAARDPKHAPAFVPLEPFTVNLTDRETDRYAQIGVTLELAEPATADAIKAFMPAIRNNILLVLSHKSAAELLDRDGKTRLAQEIRRETARGLGVADGAAGGQAAQPVAAVYYSTFIIQ